MKCRRVEDDVNSAIEQFRSFLWVFHEKVTGMLQDLVPDDPLEPGYLEILDAIGLSVNNDIYMIKKV